MSVSVCTGDLALACHQATEDNDPVEADRLRCLFLKEAKKRLDSLMRTYVLEALAEMRVKSEHCKR